MTEISDEEYIGHLQEQIRLLKEIVEVKDRTIFLKDERIGFLEQIRDLKAASSEPGRPCFVPKRDKDDHTEAELIKIYGIR